MKIDVIKVNFDSFTSLANVHSLTYFKKNYVHWFKTDGDIYVRYVGKKLVGCWRYFPNRSTDFYRCPKVTSQILINKLDKCFVENIIRDFKE